MDLIPLCTELSSQTDTGIWLLCGWTSGFWKLSCNSTMISCSPEVDPTSDSSQYNMRISTYYTPTRIEENAAHANQDRGKCSTLKPGAILGIWPEGHGGGAQSIFQILEKKYF